ncbi:phosphopantetheine-binding protein [Dyadobacter psychrotolerans]|uniref:Acyl carrier protein n=1 Tax=Dyadobacter psychrotolerans TaxID=2541721 RepID=A0A4V2Z2U8_9BACT|nr:phosphopantetheine-binding protein [Dyadobacter psychrotolerans]TDE10288.1 acyl carrier protein [Dyadobacter psychrotolerans]
MYAKDVKMSLEEVIEETRDFLSEEFEVDRDLILPQNSLKDTLDLDSLDYVDLVVLIEENLNIKISGEDFKGIVTFEDFYGLVQQKLGL